MGAQPSATVARLLGQAGVIPKPPPGLHKGAVKVRAACKLEQLHCLQGAKLEQLGRQQQQQQQPG